MPRLMVLVRPEGRDGPAGGGALRLRGVLHRLAGTGRRSADRRVGQLRPRPGAPGAVHRGLVARQARDLREADGRFASRTPGGCASGGRGGRQGDVYLQLPLHARRAVRQGPDRRGQDRHRLPDPRAVLADGRPRSVAAAREGVVLGLAALRRVAGDRQPRHRPVPVPGRRDGQRLGPGADVQQGSGDSQRRLPGRSDRRRRHRRRAGICQRRDRRAGIVGGRHRPKELSSPGKSTAPTARSAGTWSIPTACSPAWAARATIRSWASPKSP